MDDTASEHVWSRSKPSDAALSTLLSSVLKFSFSVGIDCRLANGPQKNYISEDHCLVTTTLYLDLVLPLLKVITEADCEVQEASLVEPSEHVTDVARRIMSVELDGPRSSSGATDGEGVNKRANQELAPSGAVFVQDVPACGDSSLA